MMENIYSKISVVTIPRFKIAKYIVISKEPEDESIAYMERWADRNGLNQMDGYTKRKIGWDFPASKQQSAQFGLHGYVAAMILPDDFEPKAGGAEIVFVEEDTYATLTITDPMREPWKRIPTGFQKLMRSGKPKTLAWEDRVCDSWGNRIAFEEFYTKDGVEYMDLFVPIADN